MSNANTPAANSTTRVNTNPDYDLPGNDLDRRHRTPPQGEKVPLYMKVFGVLCIINGVVMLPLLGAFYALIGFSLYQNGDLALVGSNMTLTVTVVVIGAVVELVAAVASIIFGWSLFKSYRRDVARWAYLLIALTVAQLLVDIMLQGINGGLIWPAVRLAVYVVISTTIDPSLQQERELQRKLQTMEDREAASVGLLGRDLSGKGYIKLNFFNLFWVFMVCCVLGLILEVIWHMVVVDPGVYQDRAGMLFGPFSPIYGFGAVLLTMALNRFYRANPVIIFLVSAVIGGTFEAAVSWWMQTSFGAVAWDYPLELAAGIPDPVAILYGGRTSTPFACMWGLLGVVWIKICLPRLLELINLIPWKLRYSLTVIVAALMIVNGGMTVCALDCWFSRESGHEPSSPAEQFFAEHFDNDYMEHRFESMTIHPDVSSRIDGGAVDAASPEA